MKVSEVKKSDIKSAHIRYEGDQNVDWILTLRNGEKLEVQSIGQGSPEFNDNGVTRAVHHVNKELEDWLMTSLNITMSDYFNDEEECIDFDMDMDSGTITGVEVQKPKPDGDYDYDFSWKNHTFQFDTTFFK